VRIKETQEETAESIKKGTPWPVAHAHLLHINWPTFGGGNPSSASQTGPIQSRRRSLGCGVL